MNEYVVKPIGTIQAKEEGFFVTLEPEYRAGLKGLEGFSHVAVFWWCHGCDDEMGRAVLECPSPYRLAPPALGVFATRSPMRPNPLALSVSELLEVDHENGRLRLAYTDAMEGTPVLDVKPYTPSMDRVEQPGVPGWCAHWPRSLETSGDFDWSGEFSWK